MLCPGVQITTGKCGIVIRAFYTPIWLIARTVFDALCDIVDYMKLYGTYEYDEALATKMYDALRDAYSDKAIMHNYHKVYAHILAGKTVNNFLEIGLFLNELQHTDLNAWAAIYPEANIYGADVKESQLFNRDNIQTMYADQSDTDSLTALKVAYPVEFDVILDDAQHMHGPTINTFVNLYPALKSGGVYMIEDCQGDNPDNNGWQQTVAGLTEYFDENGYTYEVFQARTPNKKRNPEYHPDSEKPEFLEEDAPSDDYVICVYKA
jgi:hypothetical protein